MIIYGLGNNASKYFATRHNVGRLLVEALGSGEFKSKQGYLYRASGAHTHLLTAGFMNESGLPLVAYCRYFKAEPGTLLVVQDDSDQVEGAVKLVRGGGSAGHHGINSIYRHLVGTPYSKDDVWRLKIGIRPVGNRLKSETFVLKPNLAVITQTLARVARQLSDLPLDPDWSKYQTLINTKV